MKQPLLKYSILFATGLLSARAQLHAQSTAQAQSAIHYQILPGSSRALPGSPDRPDMLIQNAERRLSSGVFDPVAAPLLQGAEKFTKAVFNMPSLQFQRAVTERVLSGAQKGDVLIAEWTFEEPFGKGSIVLSDTPYYSNYDLRIGGCHIVSRADLTSFLDAFLAWGKGPILWSKPPTREGPATEAPMKVTLGSETPAITFFDGFVLRSPTPMIADFNFRALLEGANWFLDFGIGKDTTQAFLGVPPFVPERFPPLSKLVTSWSYEKIRGEVGNEVRPFVGVQDLAQYRDRILIAELARRGLSQEQLIDLLTDVHPSPTTYYMRYSAMGLSFRDAGKGAIESLYFDPVLAAYQRIGTQADQAVSALFGNSAIQGCSSQTEAKALDVLKGGVFLVGPLRYLQSCSRSNETIITLEATNMPTEKLEDEKERTIDTIRRHIEHPPRPRKRPAVAQANQ